MLSFISLKSANFKSMNLEFLDNAFDMVSSGIQWIRTLILSFVAAAIDLAIMGWLITYYTAETIILTFTPTFLRKQRSLRGKVIVLTGGAGGVGQELALRLARNQAKVVIWDVNEKGMNEIKEKIENEGHQVHVYTVDVTDRKSVYKNADLVKSEVGVVDILINNAGIVCGNTCLDIPDYMVEKTFQVNILSQYWTVKAFLGDMIKNGKGHIVTVSSLTGMLGTYKCTDYSASKHATIGFHESLLTELKTHGQKGINMTIVCPYFINTGMFNGCKPKNMAMLEPRDVAKRIITAIKLKEVFVTMPWWARFILPLKNFIPAKLSWAIIYRLIKGPQSMMGMRAFQETEAA
ncbi:epidermal retinol dehydrogenase 2 [Onthophagus taurus]|uniref:epidermal retinol dehydrogenase 2 n=1 Tax=Onthophagus taurus TaxID=166361 RepID=UPI000C206010|nr:epidermal retinol dehydrogenase 2 [Onthophagus taurus]